MVWTLNLLKMCCSWSRQWLVNSEAGRRSRTVYATGGPEFKVFARISLLNYPNFDDEFPEYPLFCTLACPNHMWFLDVSSPPPHLLPPRIPKLHTPLPCQKGYRCLDSGREEGGQKGGLLFNAMVYLRVSTFSKGSEEVR